MAFDTLAYAKHLEQAGVERRQAEAHAEAMNQYLRPELATKADIAALEQSTKADSTALGQSTKAAIAALEQRIDQRLTVLEQSLRAEIKSEIAALEQRLQRLIHQTQLQTLGIMAAMLGILFALLRFTGSG
jgi:hypothetical protein